MAVYRYGFDIHRPNPGIALGAASLGETMRSNRAAEAQRDAAAQAQAAQLQEEQRRYGHDEARAAMTAVGELYNRTGAIEDPNARQAAFARGHEMLRRRFPARNGVDPFADFDNVWRQDEFDALRQMPDAPKPTTNERDLIAAGFEPGTPEFQKAMLDLKMKPNTTIDMAGVMADQPITPEIGARFNIPEDQWPNYVLRKGELRRRDMTVAEEEAARIGARRAEGLRNMQGIWQDYSDSVANAPRDPVTGQFVLSTDQRSKLAGIRERLVASVAKNVLGTPGAEPSPILNQIADRLVPQWGAGSDMLGFQGGMAALLDSETRERLRAEAQAADKAGDASGGPTTAGGLESMSDEQVEAISETDIGNMSEAELDAYIARMQRIRR